MTTRQAFEFVPVTDRISGEIEAFNQRMAAGGSRERLGVGAAFANIDVGPDSPVSVEQWACLVGGTLRGAVTIKRLPFRIAGRPEDVAFISRPLSEGIIDPTFAMVGMMIQKQIALTHPLTYGLGVGSMDEPAARLMTACGWSATPVPFQFAPVHARAFLKNTAAVRGSPSRRRLADAAANTGLGAIGLGGWRAVQRARGRVASTTGVEIMRHAPWGAWADDLWETHRDDYPFVGDRSANTLASLYPPDHPRFLRLRVRRAGCDLGWAVLVAARLDGHNHFGDLTLGTVVDVFAGPRDAVDVARAAVAVASELADLVVVNHSSRTWNRAFARAGLISGPTNYFLFLSPVLRRRFEGRNAPSESFVTRGDGDGPINLW